MTAFVVLVSLLWLPGVLLRRVTGLAPGPWGSGRFAVEAALSLAVLSAVLLPLYLARAPVWTAPAVAAAAVLLLGAAVLGRRAGGPARLASGAGLADGASRAELACFAAAVALLLPATLGHAGANIDDWWDLSFVAGWLAEGRFGFSQMALTADPGTHASAAHPRFLWSVWLMLQATVSSVTGEAAWKIQGGALAAAVTVLVVSAQAALAKALFREQGSAAAMAAATVAMTAAWIWGTEALPLFVRGYQDKLTAAFVLSPVLLALFVEAVRRPSRAATLSVAAAAVATVSVHSLVFTMAVFVCVLALVALEGRGALRRLRERVGILAALALPALYPLGQAAWLAGTFSEQGVSLATRDNPVVRAHLSLNRLIGEVGPAWIVHPGAVFGTIVLAAVVAFAVAWRHRRTDAAARVLVAVSAVPCVLLFVPGVAALAGKLWVPWMLYRLGWLMPVAPLVGYALVVLRDRARGRGRLPLASAALAVLVAALSIPTATDRLWRGMDEHPGQPPGAPWGAAAVVFDFLAREEGRAPVLALANFSELVPAITGKPVVAFPERGTLVFAGDETRAYERLRDRATFFAASAPPARRDEVAGRYDVRWAVLPRRQVASGSEAAWLRRFGPEAFLAARRSDDAGGEPCEDGPDAGSPAVERCRTWWSATRESTAAHLSREWTITLETRDYFVVERTAQATASAVASERAAASAVASERAAASAVASRKPTAPSVASGDSARESPARWLAPFDLTPPAAREDGAVVLASATEAPGAGLRFAIAPRYILPDVLPVWADGPGAWEDAPMDASITLEMDGACRVAAVEVVPHLPRERRDVLELRIGPRVVRAAARHNSPIVVALADAELRRSVTIDATSLLGNPVSLADLRLLGDAASCEPGRPEPRRPKAPEMAASDASLLSITPVLPGGRALVSLARHAGGRRGKEDAAVLLGEATRREPTLVEAWIDLGFAQDELAASASSPAAAEAAREAAREAFRGAVRADSRSAWARGCLAWSEYRAGRGMRALVHSLAAASLDPLYADSWTVLAYALGNLRLDALAGWSLEVAEATDPHRNWPALARADLALQRGDPEAARRALRAWIERHPFDEAVRDKLAAVEAGESSPGGGVNAK